jgi:hypothetical protein
VPFYGVSGVSWSQRHLGFEAPAIISYAVGCGAKLLVKKYFRAHDFCERLSFA